MSKKVKLTLLTSMLALLAWVGYGALHADAALTEKPERFAMESVSSAVSSNVSIPIRIDREVMTQLANDLIPPSYDIPRQTVFHDESWTKNPFNGNKIVLWSITIDGYGHIERTSPVSVTADQNLIQLSTTVHGSFTAAKGHATETATADAHVSVAIGLDVNEKWEPVVTVTPTYRWIKRPEARLFGLFTLSLGSVAEKEMDKLIAKLKAELPAFVRESLPLPTIMASAWSDSHTAVQLSREPEAWLTFDPTSAHLLAPRAQDGDLLLNIGMVADVGLSTEKPEAPKPEPLPDLQKALADESGLRIGVPIQLGYTALRDALLTAVRDDLITFPTPAGEVELHVRQMEIYPAAPNLVVGVEIDMDVPNRWLDTKGWIYLYAEPSFDAGTRQLRLRNARFARVIDNKAIRLFTAAFAAQIGRELERLTAVDLSKPVDGAMASANALLGPELQKQIRQQAAKGGRPLQGVVERVEVVAKIDALESVTFTVAESYLTVVPVVTGSLSVQWQPSLGAMEGSRDAKVSSAARAPLSPTSAAK